jgi:hypothetical protein
MKVEVRVDKLVLDGPGPVAPEQVKAAVARELSRQIAEQGVPARLRESASLGTVDGGRLPGSARPGPQALARGIAGAVYRGLDK